MGKKGVFCKLRAQLDEAITYYTKDKAIKIAKAGLKDSFDKGARGEIEYFKGQLEILKGNFAAAIEHFDLAIKYNPNDGASYNDRALCMVELGVIDGVLYYFDKGIEVEPDYATIYHNKGWLLNNIGHYRQALECFRKALELEPERPVTYDNIADALYNLCDYKGALEAYKKVLELLKPGSARGIRVQIKEKIKYLRKSIKNSFQPGRGKKYVNKNNRVEK